MMNIPKMAHANNPLTPNSFQTPPYQFNQIGHSQSQGQSQPQGQIPGQNLQEKPKVPQFFQFEYPTNLYQTELDIHHQSLEEYDEEIYQVMADLLEANKPNLDLYKQQPYLTFSIRLKLIDFLLKMSIRLKILPFVFFKAVKIFDRYCSKRIVLLDQSQLIITTCLWIASKVQGGNNHFVNLTNLEKLTSVKTINDLGYGSGGKYLGPTERFRLPKLHELVKLCGAKCKYDQGMFKQMELHVLTTLDWSLNDPSIEEFIVTSEEFSIIPSTDDGTSLNLHEMFRIKEFLSYISLYSFELIDTNVIDLAKVMTDLINETFSLGANDRHFQVVLPIHTAEPLDINKYKHIKKSLIKAILSASDFVLKLFGSQGCQYLYHQIHTSYKNPYNPAPSTSLASPSSISLTPRKRSTSTIHSGSSGPGVVSGSGSTGFTSFSSKKSSPSAYHSHPYHQMSTPPPRASCKSFGSPSSMPSSVPPPIPSKNIYKPFYAHSPNGYTCTRTLYKLPSIQTTQGSQYNHSQASLNSSVSSKGDSHEVADIFECDYSRKGGISTPLSENESPIYSMVKQQ